MKSIVWYVLVMVFTNSNGRVHTGVSAEQSLEACQQAGAYAVTLAKQAGGSGLWSCHALSVREARDGSIGLEFPKGEGGDDIRR
jgi:hypothetical protein